MVLSLGCPQPQVPPELENAVDSMVVQHLNLYDWGTSNPIYSSLVSGFVQSTSTRGPNFTGRSILDPTVGGVLDRRATDQRLLTNINCGEGSYLERVSELVSLVLQLEELCRSPAFASA